MKAEIIINGQQKPMDPGLVTTDALYELADSGTQRMFLKREDGLDIPLLPGECILVRGGEEFVIGESAIEDNPILRNAIKPEFNGKHDIRLRQAKITAKDLVAKDDKFPRGRLFADMKATVDVEIPADAILIVQDKDSFLVMPPVTGEEDHPIDIEECGKHGRRPSKASKYRIRIDGERLVVDSAVITGAVILQLVGKNFSEWTLNQKLQGGKREKLAKDSEVDLTKPGIERFETVRLQAQQG